MTVYDVAYALALIGSAPIWLTAPKLRRKVLDALRDRNGAVPLATDASPAVLIHAVSLGEINATTELVRLLAAARPDLRFIISTTSRTGETQARKLYQNNSRITLIRYPFDFSRPVARMFTAQRPAIAVLMELEVWPNFIRECTRRGIPVILANGRLSAHSFRGYRLGGPLVWRMFARLSLACVQDNIYARRFERVGVPADRIRVTGTMKFDTARVADQIDGAADLAENLRLTPGKELIWVCGSTGPGEERLVLDAFSVLRKKYPKLRLAIIPRHPERFDLVADLIRAHGFSVVRRSQATAPLTHDPAEKDVPAGCDMGVSQSLEDDLMPVILGDTMGELRKFYSLANVVFVGRSLVDLGAKQHGSDMIEPAALAKVVIVGPFTSNFADVMNRFRDRQAIQEVKDSLQLEHAVAEALGSPEAAGEMESGAQATVRENQGATRRHVQFIIDHLPPEMQAN